LIAQLESDPEHTQYVRIYVVILKLILVKVINIEKSGNSDQNSMWSFIETRKLLSFCTIISITVCDFNFSINWYQTAHFAGSIIDIFYQEKVSVSVVHPNRLLRFRGWVPWRTIRWFHKGQFAWRSEGTFQAALQALPLKRRGEVLSSCRNKRKQSMPFCAPERFSRGQSIPETEKRSTGSESVFSFFSRNFVNPCRSCSALPNGAEHKTPLTT